tara:strand:+ start:3704 stop:3904 length:201 start_codon:yes stop_codon:yes gene_type:complete
MESLDSLIREDFNITELKNLKKLFNEKINSRIFEIRENREIKKSKKSRTKKIVRPPLYISDSSDDE